MPQPMFPPTPGSSTEIAGKSDVYISQLDHGFALPPAALDVHISTNAGLNAGISKHSSKFSSVSSSVHQPLSPSSPVNAPTCGVAASCKRKAGNDNVSCGDFVDVQHDGWCAESVENNCTLPPPPTRSRKIIQMKPCTVQDKSSVNRINSSIMSSGVDDTKARQAARKGTEAEVTAISSVAIRSSNGNRATRRKDAGDVDAPTSAAGRKSARKTAHSIIERRRRSKMNEEFGVLKDMIPACAGQEMHKLAILQASIEYMRYLKQCITDLQSSKRQQHLTTTSVASRKSSACSPVAHSVINSDSTQNLCRSAQQDHDGRIPCKDSSTAAQSHKERINDPCNSAKKPALTPNPMFNDGSNKCTTDIAKNSNDAPSSRKSSSSELFFLASDVNGKTEDFMTASSTTTDNLSTEYEPRQSYQRQLEQDYACSKLKLNSTEAVSFSQSLSTRKRQSHTASTSSPYSLSALASAATLPSLPSTPTTIDHPRQFSLEHRDLGRTGSGSIPASTCNVNKSYHTISPLCSPALAPNTSSARINTVILAASETQDGIQATDAIDVKDANRRSDANKRLIEHDTRDSMTDDHEATTALLMLNRAVAGAGDGGRGMSVRDILSG